MDYSYYQLIQEVRTSNDLLETQNDKLDILHEDIWTFILVCGVFLVVIIVFLFFHNDK